MDPREIWLLVLSVLIVSALAFDGWLILRGNARRLLLAGSVAVNVFAGMLLLLALIISLTGR